MHALREGDGGNSPQITKEDYAAWRRDIDTDYHIHYWKKGEIVKLANIVHHNDYKISWN